MKQANLLFFSTFLLAACGSAPQPKDYSVEPGRMELAGRNRLQARACREGHDVVGAEFQPADQVRFGQRFAHDQDRYARGDPRALFHRILELVAVGDAQENQLRVVRRRERVAEAGEVAHPGAVHRLAGIAQGAVDDFDRILLPRQDDDRDGAVFGQDPTPLARGTRGARRGKNIVKSRRIIASGLRALA